MNRPLQMLTIGLAGVLFGAMLGVLSTSGDSNDEAGGPTQPVITDRTVDPAPTEPAPEQSHDDGRLEELTQRLQDSEQRVARLEEELDQAGIREQALYRDLAEVRAEREALDAALSELRESTAEVEAPARKGPAISFGEYAELDELKDADWDKLGDSAGSMIPLMIEMRELLARGEDIPRDLQERVGRYNMNLVAHYMQVRDKLPTHAAANGEYSHPINLANMLDAQLRVAEMPLSDAQRAAIAAHGNEFESRWKASKAGYTDRTFRMEKLLDEAVHKEWFKQQMLSELTPQQRALVAPPELDGLLYMDLYSPALMFVSSMAPILGPDRNALGATLLEQMAGLFRIDGQRMEAASHLITMWFNQYEPKQVDQAGMSSVHLNEILDAMRGQLAAMQELHANFADTDEQRRRIRDEATVLLPRIVQG
jgi:hypothetical protein